MTRDDVERARGLCAHVDELQAFVCDLATHYAAPAGPAKTAEHYQLVRRCEALRQKIEPPRGLQGRA